jgi:hypothetical protein
MEKDRKTNDKRKKEPIKQKQERIAEVGKVKGKGKGI